MAASHQALVQALAHEKGNLSHSLQNLERKGLVTIARTPGDSLAKFNITFIGSLSGKNIDDTAITTAATVGTTAIIAKTTDGSSPTAAQVQASLNTITGLTGNVTVTGDAGGPFTITVKNGGNIANLDVSHFTGGLNPSITPVTGRSTRTRPRTSAGSPSPPDSASRGSRQGARHDRS